MTERPGAAIYRLAQGADAPFGSEQRLTILEVLLAYLVDDMMCRGLMDEGQVRAILDGTQSAVMSGLEGHLADNSAQVRALGSACRFEIGLMRRLLRV